MHSSNCCKYCVTMQCPQCGLHMSCLPKSIFCWTFIKTQSTPHPRQWCFAPMLNMMTGTPATALFVLGKRRSTCSRVLCIARYSHQDHNHFDAIIKYRWNQSTRTCTAQTTPSRECSASSDLRPPRYIPPIRIHHVNSLRCPWRWRGWAGSSKFPKSDKIGSKLDKRRIFRPKIL